jgi:adenine deaminase
MSQSTLYHHLIDLHQSKIYPAEIIIENDKIISIQETEKACENYILPGLIDAHIHIESSMLLPSEFAKIAVTHGTIATISDPHEIANVCGVEGIEYMIRNGNKVPLKFHFGAPSCVPATSFESAGAIIDADAIDRLMQRDEIFYLSEMMNYPGVLFEDEEVMKKIAISKKYDKPVDGHAPGLRGEHAKKYIEAGITTDHECFTYDEALDKLSLGMKILIREGSAAKNFDALIELLPAHYRNMMFCCDDKHPDELMLHHINHHVKRALAKGFDLFKVLQVACLNPVRHYNMKVGLLQQNDLADFIVIDSIENFNVLQTYINGQKVFDKGEVNFTTQQEIPINTFNCETKSLKDFSIPTHHSAINIRVIEALEGQLITQTIHAPAKIENGNLVSDIENDILKIVVVNRYHEAPIAKAFIKNIGLKNGAIASTVAHDSHNIIAVGINDEMICKAVNAIIESQGGICVIDEVQIHHMALPVAGLMSYESAEFVSNKYAQLDLAAKQLGSTLHAPFMTLSFMALLVIPQLKLSDKGLFDGKKFTFVDIFV